MLAIIEDILSTECKLKNIFKEYLYYKATPKKGVWDFSCYHWGLWPYFFCLSSFHMQYTL